MGATEVAHLYFGLGYDVEHPGVYLALGDRQKLSHMQSAVKPDENQVFVEELEAQTDRGVAIVAAAYLDAELEKALRSYFAPNVSSKYQQALFDGAGAAAGTFSARIRLTHAIGLIGSDSEHDLHLIRSIRNDFAHSLAVKSFAEPSISAKCMKLKLTNRALEIGGIPPTQDPRKRLILSTCNVIHFMYGELRARVVGALRPMVSP
jgi:DNA-binding MltR family transcriptional regulator